VTLHRALSISCESGGSEITPLYVVLAIFVVLLLWGVAVFNRLVRRRNLVGEGWSGIDVQLKRRADLIPNLIEAVKGYMGHERGVLEKVTQLRVDSQKATSPAEKGRIEGALGSALASVFAVAENYPDLKASQNFSDLQKSLADIEEQIQLARRYYNGAVREQNIVIESFPSDIVARLFHFQRAEFFQLESIADRQVPQVRFP
jgi:LemA protein